VSHLVVVAAGTGGHVMPGLAVAEALRSRGWTVSWLGTRAGMERSLVERRGIAFDAIDFSSLRGKGIGALLLGGFRLLRALWQSRAAIRVRRPSIVFSTGGYVAVPAAFAASMASVPLTLLNADAAPLLSTRMLRALASAVFCGFEGAAASLAGERGLVTGNPVRADIAELPPPIERYSGRSGPLKLLVIGGSLGSRILNETVPAALALLPAPVRPSVIHQCGADHVQATRDAYTRLAVDAEVMPFLDDMARRYGDADVVLCRAGAITVTEVAACGVASILVPLVVSTTAHQRTNAEFMAANSAAIHLPQAELSTERLAGLLRGLTRARLLEMASRARALGHPEATRVVADAIEHVAREAGR
jgi:UDP-N-acetylglucosamine--N-acetylmuramyl-(pentapeptide) pyrophosphoryl-undecaprenol N-acetylglucosamine transferase